ncbi:hypothetical protein Tco_0068636, partial [Tanacetum coccineum]
PEVPESVLESLTAIPAMMKPMQLVRPSKTPMKRSDSPASGCESCMPAAQSELLNSSLPNVPKPLEKLEPPDPTIVQSPGGTVYPRPIHQLYEITESAYPEYPL